MAAGLAVVRVVPPVVTPLAMHFNYFHVFKYFSANLIVATSRKTCVVVKSLNSCKKKVYENQRSELHKRK